MPDSKIVRNWPHMAYQVVEVPGTGKPGLLRLAPPIWAHFVDLYLGLGSWKLKGNEKPEELRERALRALESCWRGFPKLGDGFRALGLDGLPMVVRVDHTIDTSVTAQ